MNVKSDLKLFFFAKMLKKSQTQTKSSPKFIFLPTFHVYLIRKYIKLAKGVNNCKKGGEKN